MVVLDHLTPTQRRALVITDNRLAEQRGWDAELLRLELDALQDEDFDLSLTGFDADDLAELLADEETTRPVRPMTTGTRGPGHAGLAARRCLAAGRAPGAVRRCHRSGQLRASARGNRADMVLTDPPYNVNYANSAKDKLRGKDRPILNDNLGEDFGPSCKRR